MGTCPKSETPFEANGQYSFAILRDKEYMSNISYRGAKTRENGSITDPTKKIQEVLEIRTKVNV